MIINEKNKQKIEYTHDELVSKYISLFNAVYDLLSELRIDEKCLEVMANGYSPDYPGAVDLKVDEKWSNPYCKVQLSKVVSKKLIDCGVI